VVGGLAVCVRARRVGRWRGYERGDDGDGDGGGREGQTVAAEAEAAAGRRGL
jgi:hypothetical protein